MAVLNLNLALRERLWRKYSAQERIHKRQFLKICLRKKALGFFGKFLAQAAEYGFKPAYINAEHIAKDTGVIPLSFNRGKYITEMSILSIGGGQMERIKILLVDDERDFLEFMGVRIRSWGYDLISASSGKEAIQAVKSREPDIVILDYLMPDMDGVGTLKEIRKIKKGIPVIMFTAHPEMKVQQAVKHLKVSAFIPKLSVYSEVQSVLKTALDLVKMNLENQSVENKRIYNAETREKVIR